MKKNPQDVKYNLSAISNFLAAIGGGTILGKGVNVLDTPILHGGSILAFIIGTVFGLLFLRIIPKKISTPIARWFSVFAGLISLILLIIFNIYSIDNRLTNVAALIFFFLLSIRFGFWFYSRVLRAASVAGQQQKIAWVELGYYSGMIAGLILWNILDVKFGIAAAFMIDACLQFTAGYIDFNVNQNKPMIDLSSYKIDTSDKTLLKHKNNWFWKLTFSVVLLTIGTQVIIFSLAHQVIDSITSYILAIYYIGVSLGAYFCRLFNIQIEWEMTNYKVVNPIFIFHFKNNVKKINATWNYIILTTCISVSIIGVVNLQWGITNPSASWLLFIFVAIAAFFYEIFALSLLDKIGFYEKKSNQTGLVTRTYGYMGIGAAVGFWTLSILHNSVFGLIGLLLACFILTIFFIYRKFHDENLLQLGV